MLPSDDRWSGDWAVTSLSLIDHVECLVLCYMYKIPVLSETNANTGGGQTILVGSSSLLTMFLCCKRGI